MTNPPRRRGRPRHRGRFRQEILTSARRLLADNSGRGLTLRTVAAAAGVDPALVVYYFGGKQQLLREALQLPADMASMVTALTHVPDEQLAEHLCRALLVPREADGLAPLHAYLLAATHGVPLLDDDPRTRIIPVLTARAGPPDDTAVLRAQLALSVLIGAVMARNVISLQPLAALPSGAVVDAVKTAVHQMLSVSL